MHTKTALTICLLFCSATQAQVVLEESGDRSLSRRLFGKSSFIRSGVSSGWNFIRNSPYEWGRTTGGFGKRYASSFGRHLVKGSVKFGVGSLRKEYLDYSKSEETGFGRRLRHAVLSTVVTRKTTTGRPTMAVGNVTGTFTGGFVSRIWHPSRLQTVSSGLTTSGVSLGIDAGTNVIREFWAEIRHPRRRRTAEELATADVDPADNACERVE